MIVNCNKDINTIVIQLNHEKAPVTVNNFLSYCNDGFYEGTIFHRVISDFVIQGGGFTSSLIEKATRDSIINEADNGLSNLRGTIAMARTPEPHSATSQFYINVEDNVRLDHKNHTDEGYGYCVFGEVIEGMDVVNSIRSTKVHNINPELRDVPKKAISITNVKVDGYTVTLEIEFGEYPPKYDELDTPQ
ncbi:peptidylprolyl isomerase [Methanococcoides sp. SA1]|nr:peptidylprolyl isomerase [Methanococcoides sp. SA1]